MKKTPSKRGKAKQSGTLRPRRKLVPASEEMRRWSAMLESELSGWPGLTAKPMFGFQAYYRAKKIFTAIPRTRGFGAPNSLMVKFLPVPEKLRAKVRRDPRLSPPTAVPGNGWHAFEMNSVDDLRDALWWLGQAYELAGK